MADRLSPCVLSGRFALCSFSDDLSLPVSESVCACSFVCSSTQLESGFWASTSCEHFFVYSTVNHKGFIALPELICVHTGTCLFIAKITARLLLNLCVIVSCAFTCVFVLMWVNMCVLTNLGRLHCTHQDISVEKWQCQCTDSCVCVREDWWACVWQQPYCGEREGWHGGRIWGRSVVAPSSSQVNIDTAWADTAPTALINHFQWTHTNTLRHTQAQARRRTSHIVRHSRRNKNTL